ncbi:hypothetical protein ACRAWD_12560 [Caulobacter segnis]
MTATRVFPAPGREVTGEKLHRLDWRVRGPLRRAPVAAHRPAAGLAAEIWNARSTARPSRIRACSWTTRPAPTPAETILALGAESNRRSDSLVVRERRWRAPITSWTAAPAISRTASPNRLPAARVKQGRGAAWRTLGQGDLAGPCPQAEHRGRGADGDLAHQPERRHRRPAEAVLSIPSPGCWRHGRRPPPTSCACASSARSASWTSAISRGSPSAGTGYRDRHRSTPANPISSPERSLDDRDGLGKRRFGRRPRCCCTVIPRSRTSSTDPDPDDLRRRLRAISATGLATSTRST